MYPYVVVLCCVSVNLCDGEPELKVGRGILHDLCLLCKGEFEVKVVRMKGFDP